MTRVFRTCTNQALASVPAEGWAGGSPSPTVLPVSEAHALHRLQPRIGSADRYTVGDGEPPAALRAQMESLIRARGFPSPLLMILVALLLAGASGPATAEVVAWTAADWPAEPSEFQVDPGDGAMALEAYAGGRHRAVAQRIVPASSLRVSSLALKVGQARGGARGAAVNVRFAELREGEEPDAGRPLFEGVVRLPEEIPDGSILGFRFDPVTLRAGQAYAFSMQFEEPAALRAVSFRTGIVRDDPARFTMNEDRKGWKRSNDRAQEMRWYRELPADAYTDVPRRLEDLEIGGMAVSVADGIGVEPAAVEQRATDPDQFKVHGIWHGGGGRQDFAQTFRWPSSEPLEGVRVRIRDYAVPYHGGAAGAPLELAIVELAEDGGFGPPVGRWRGQVPERLRHSVWLGLEPSDGPVPLKADTDYALRLGFPEPGRDRHLSLSAALGDLYPGGRLLREQNGGGFRPLVDDAEADLSFQLLTAADRRERP